MAGEQQTGTKDTTYNLISVMYHALQAAETIGGYLGDAEGDQELTACFDKAIEENREIAERCKKLLASRLSEGEEPSRSKNEEQQPGLNS
jgi:hypothetical protein